MEAVCFHGAGQILNGLLLLKSCCRAPMVGGRGGRGEEEEEEQPSMEAEAEEEK